MGGGLAFQVTEVRTCLSRRPINQPLDLCEGSSWEKEVRSTLTLTPASAHQHTRGKVMYGGMCGNKQADFRKQRYVSGRGTFNRGLKPDTPPDLLSNICLCDRGPNIVYYTAMYPNSDILKCKCRNVVWFLLILLYELLYLYEQL